MARGGKPPSLPFYPGDWQRDTNLRFCSLAGRGLWIELLCIMHFGEPYGHLAINGHEIRPEAVASRVGASQEEYHQLIHELEDSGVFSRTDEGIIYSRRLVREHEERLRRQTAGKKGGNPSLVKDNQVVNHEVNHSDNREVIEISAEAEAEANAEAESNKRGKGDGKGGRKDPVGSASNPAILDLTKKKPGPYEFMMMYHLEYHLEYSTDEQLLAAKSVTCDDSNANEWTEAPWAFKRRLGEARNILNGRSFDQAVKLLREWFDNPPEWWDQKGHELCLMNHVIPKIQLRIKQKGQQRELYRSDGQPYDIDDSDGRRPEDRNQFPEPDHQEIPDFLR